jgi:hypothetical protein
MVPENVRKLQRIMLQAKALKYNGIVLDDFKFHILDRLEAEYFYNLEEVRRSAAEFDLDLYPVVATVGYSNGVLTHDPNQAEGVPVVRAPFLASNDEAALLAPPPMQLNGDQVVRVSRFRQYHLSVEVKTKDFSSPEALPAVVALDGRKLAYFDRLPEVTQDWTTHQVVFNSLDHDWLEVRPAGWLKGSGEYYWKDAWLNEIELVNVIRRDGAPLTVSDADSVVQYEEGKDFAIESRQSGLMPRPGEFDVYHRPLRIFLPAGSRILSGQTILVNYYHALIVREGAVTNCLSAPDVYQHRREQIYRVQELLKPRGFLLGIDEVRVANWCESCRSRAITPGQLLAENVRRSIAVVREVNPSADILVWSDMFDPFHNAHDHYYAVNGDAGGSWEGLDQEVIVATWNFKAIGPSLKWFASRGHRQVIVGYFDHDTSEIAEWIKAATSLKGISGAMYMTWRQDYSQLGTFADRMWHGAE